jgi:hypothetical protein
MPIEKGDIIVVKYVMAIVDRILYQDIDDGFHLIEFYDTQGNYRYWKQRFERGNLFKCGGK